jgi:hypothetical protein
VRSSTRENVYFIAIVLGILSVLGAAGAWLAIYLENEDNSYEQLVRKEQAKCEALGGHYWRSQEDNNICFQKGVTFPSASRR